MATQEPNVYAGLSVVIGGLMHARPKFFAKVMGELLFWVGEDKMTFGSDYGIWEPKWQVEGFVDWEYAGRRGVLRLPEARHRGKKKILGLNAAKLYDIEVPAEYQLQGRRHARRRTRCSPASPTSTRPREHDRSDGSQRGRRPGPAGPPPGGQRRCWPRWRRCATRSWTSRSPRSASSPRAPSPRPGTPQVRLRLPTYFCAPNFAFLMVADAYDAVSALPGVRRAEVVLEDHFASDAINGGVAAQAGFGQSFDGEAVGELHELRADFLRKAVMAGTDQVCRPLLAARHRPGPAAGR